MSEDGDSVCAEELGNLSDASVEFGVGSEVDDDDDVEFSNEIRACVDGEGLGGWGAAVVSRVE